MALRPLLPALVVLAGCSPVSPAVADVTAPATAEALIRTRFALPENAALAGLSTQAAPAQASVLPAALSTYLNGPSRASGLRVVASFDLPLADVEPEFWTEWQPLPFPEAVGQFKSPPVELLGLSGYYRCSVHAWSPGTDAGWAAGSCAQPPANFDSYQAAVYDPQAGRLTAVVKQYY